MSSAFLSFVRRKDRSTWGFNLLFTLPTLVLASAGCGRTSVPPAKPAVGPEGSSASNPELPKWMPDEKLLGELEQETDLPGYPNFRLRPPKGYKVETQNTKGVHRILWNGSKRADGSWPQLNVTVYSESQDEGLAQNFRNFLAGFKSTQKQLFPDWNATIPETGLINGLTAIRARFEGSTSDLNKKCTGFAYLTMDGSKGITITFEDLEPYEKETLKLSETSALTIRKK